MPAQRGAFLAAFQTHNIITLDRSANRDGGSALLDFGRAAHVLGVRRKPSWIRRSHLIRGHLVVPEIRRDDLRRVAFQANFFFVRHSHDLIVSVDRLHRSVCTDPLSDARKYIVHLKNRRVVAKRDHRFTDEVLGLGRLSASVRVETAIENDAVSAVRFRSVGGLVLSQVQHWSRRQPEWESRNAMDDARGCRHPVHMSMGLVQERQPS